MKDGVHESSQNRNNKHDFPTPTPLAPCTLADVTRLTRITDEQKLD
jgi:hypothetical protein